ncbi:hypothetical protein HDU76_011567, partial [Blyttiomyces sp. JEL0837]
MMEDMNNNTARPAPADPSSSSAASVNTHVVSAPPYQDFNSTNLIPEPQPGTPPLSATTAYYYFDNNQQHQHQHQHQQQQHHHSASSTSSSSSMMQTPQHQHVPAPSHASAPMPSSISPIRQLFDYLDPHNMGTISTVELSHYLADFGFLEDDPRFSKVFKASSSNYYTPTGNTGGGSGGGGGNLSHARSMSGDSIVSNAPSGSSGSNNNNNNANQSPVLSSQRQRPNASPSMLSTTTAGGNTNTNNNNSNTVRIQQQQKKQQRRITYDELVSLLGLETFTLLERALSRDLAIPDLPLFRDGVREIFENVLGQELGGKLASYIPQLASVDPNLFALSFCSIDGQRFSFGDSE